MRIGTISNRKLLGLVIAPLAPVLMMVRGFDLATETGRFLTAEAIIVSYVMSFVVGIPIYLIWQRRGWTSWLAYIAGAFAMGSIATPLIGLEFVLWRAHSLVAVFRTATDPRLYPGCLAFGLLAMPIGLLFWFIVRPDRV